MNNRSVTKIHAIKLMQPNLRLLDLDRQTETTQWIAHPRMRPAHHLEAVLHEDSIITGTDYNCSVTRKGRTPMVTSQSLDGTK